MSAVTPSPDTIEVSFGRSADGLLVARVGDTAFAMVPGRDCGHFLATAWRLDRPLEQWTRSDFYGHSGEIADAAAFRARVEEHAIHQRQLAALGRKEVFSRASTPWGISQAATRYAEGIVFHATAGHGGFHLIPERHARIHPALRSADGDYEEDCDWAAVAQALPDLFTDFEKASAERSILDWMPDAWEAIHGRTLESGESREKDRAAFHRAHAGDWIVVSAIRSDHSPGFTEVVATIGGRYEAAAERRRFLVPNVEYGTNGGPFGFVIDESRHRRLVNEPSSFLGGGTR
jgi:hypothetical protein